MTLAESTEPGRLGVLHLKRFWQKADLRRRRLLEGRAHHDEGKMDTTLLAVLGLGLEQTMKQVYLETGSFEAFEDWVEEVNAAGLDAAKVAAFNDCIRQRALPRTPPLPEEAVLSAEDITFWDENGYVIIRDAVSREDCEAAVAAICGFIGVDRHDPATWYAPHPGRQGIMVQLFQHPALEKTRSSPKVRAAYEQLWGRCDLWLNTDRAGFNPPETASYTFPGPRLHWDMSLAQPIPFGTQGILYLADTAADQGAFTLVPGFHRRSGEWLASLPPGANPREQDLYAMGPVPVAAGAGDFILWHHALPHGSSPNSSRLPRFVQYVNYEPLDAEVREEWI